MNQKFDARKNFIGICGREPRDLDDFGNLMPIYIDHKISGNVRKKRSKSDPHLLGLVWKIRYNQKVSNTHECPFDGVTNWRSEKTLPISYPGLSGRLWLMYSNVPPGFSSDHLRNSGLHSGTGGYGTYGGVWEPLMKKIWNRIPRQYEPYPLSYDTKIFLSDWRGIDDQVNSSIVLQNLHGSRGEFSHDFLWEHEELITLRRIHNC